MRRFSFPLERVLEWRRLEARIEEHKLERIRGELRVMDDRRADLDDSLAEAERSMSYQGRPHAAPFSALEFAALAAFRRHVATGRARLATARAGCVQRLEAQTTALARKQRDVKLMENLKDRKLTLWTAELDRELSQQAEETHLAKTRIERRHTG